MDIKALREEWKKRALDGLYPPEQIDYAKVRERRRRPPEDDDTPPELTPNDIDEQHWLSHCLLLAQTRFGKTNAICWRIMQLLPQIAAGKASLILMEPKGVLTSDVLHLADVWKMRDRVRTIDPGSQDIQINLFERVGTVNDIRGRIQRVMATITSGLTEIQRDAFTFALRAMYEFVEEPTLATFLAIIQGGRDAVPMEQLSPHVRDFFEHYEPKRDARFILLRVRSFVAGEIWEKLFGGTKTTFNLLDEIQAGKLIIIRATSRVLGEDLTLYGKFWIEQIQKCVGARLDMSEEEPTPTTVVLDEAQTYISHDPYMGRILDQAAEAKIGMLFAMHHMEQIRDPTLRQSIYTNTAIKFSSRTSADISYLSRALGDSDHLPKLLQRLPRFHFVMYHPDITEPARIRFPHTDLKKQPRISEEQYAELIKQAAPTLHEANERRSPPTPSASTPRTPKPDPPAVEGSEGASIWKGDVT